MMYNLTLDETAMALILEGLGQLPANRSRSLLNQLEAGIAQVQAQAQQAEGEKETKKRERPTELPKQPKDYGWT